MKVEELSPLPNKKEQFKLTAYKLIPKSPGCYVLTTFDSEILYIGLSDNLYERFQQHLDNPEKTKPTKKGKAVWFYYIFFDPKNLPRLERTWLNQYLAVYGELPILNKINSPIS